MNRRHPLTITLALTSTVALASAAMAAPIGEPVWLVADTTSDNQPDTFTSSIEGCETGVVTGPPDAARYTPWGGVFIGIKSFECDGDGDLGFALRLKARFGGTGSVGTWTLVEAWGEFEGAKASGSLVGTPIPDVEGIRDAYSGIVR